jgi:FixJ family two-component response regulator
MPIIMLTGFGDLLLLDTATRQNVDLVVGKPTTREKLRQAVALVVKGNKA